MYVSIREVLLKSAGYRNIRDGLADLGLDNVEVEYFRDYTAYSSESWDKISFSGHDAAETVRSAYIDKGIRICAFLLHNNFNREDQEGEIAWVIDVIEAAESLGISAIRIDAATAGEKEEPFEIRVDRFVECMKQALEATKGCSVQLGIENHGVQGNDPDFLHQVIGRVGDDRLGVNMDTGNFYWYGFPVDRVYEILRSVAPVTKYTHVKNISYPEEARSKQREVGWDYAEYVCPIYDGDIDHGRVVEILKGAGFDGPLTIEDESLHKFDEQGKKDVLKRDVAYLRGLLL
jgi:sugar phosphate isomerase/epimerase